MVLRLGREEPLVVYRWSGFLLHPNVADVVASLNKQNCETVNLLLGVYFKKRGGLGSNA
jgi:hypothetical protein